MGPVWEANHVWLIFVLVVMWTCFPHAFGPMMETLYVPLFLAAVGIILRGAAFALRGEAATIAEARALGATFALSSVLGPVLPRRRGRRGRLRPGPADGRRRRVRQLDELHLALRRRCSRSRSGAYMAAIFLAADAAARRASPTWSRRSACGRWAPAVVAGALALGGLAVVERDAPRPLRRADLGPRAGGGDRARRSPALVDARASSGRAASRPRAFTAAAAVGAILVGLALAHAPGLPARASSRSPGRRRRRRDAARDADQRRDRRSA